MAFENIWDEGCRGTGAGFFYPQEIGDPVYMDEHGNSKKEEAIKAHEIKKEIARKTNVRTQIDKYTLSASASASTLNVPTDFARIISLTRASNNDLKLILFNSLIFDSLMRTIVQPRPELHMLMLSQGHKFYFSQKLT